MRSRPRGLRGAWNSPNLSFLKGPSSSSVPGDEVPTQVPLQSSGDFPHCATPFHSRGRLCVLPACQSLPFLFQCEPGTGGQVRQPRTCRLQPSPAGQSPGPLLLLPVILPRGKRCHNSTGGTLRLTSVSVPSTLPRAFEPQGHGPDARLMLLAAESYCSPQMLEFKQVLQHEVACHHPPTATGHMLVLLPFPESASQNQGDNRHLLLQTRESP